MAIGTYTPPPGKSLHKKFFQFFIYFLFYFRCILLQISHKKCFFVSISILGRSGVNIGGISDRVPLLIVDCQVHGLLGNETIPF